jgi:hypothetical protein
MSRHLNVEVNGWVVAALQRRYRGVSVRVFFNDHVAEGIGTYRGWCVSYECPDPCVLVRHGLAPPTCDFRSGDRGELASVSWHSHPIIADSGCYGVSHHVEESPHANERDRALTKKMQSQVMRMLKPFIRGTWKSRQTV